MRVGSRLVGCLAALLLGCAAALLLGCATVVAISPPAADHPVAAADAAGELRAQYAALQAAGGQVYALDPATSRVRLFAFRAGRAARLGHNHVLSAPRFAGYVHVPDGNAALGRFDLLFELEELALDEPSARSGLGPAFASALSPDEVARTREHLLGEQGLQAAQHPRVRIHSLQVKGEPPLLAVQAEVELHGVRRPLWLPVAVEGLPQRLQASGSFVLRQSDFGVTPYETLGGLLAVADEVVVDFRLAGGPMVAP